MIQRFASLAGLALILLTVACGQEAPPAETPHAEAPPAKASIRAVSPGEVHAMLASATAPAPVLLDVRSPVEFESGHIRGAINIPYDEVASRMSEVPGEGTLVVFCAVGPRAQSAEASLQAAGVASGRILHMEGGMVAWEAAGLPVER